MATCKTCGAPVNLAPDGDPKYEAPHTRAQADAPAPATMRDDVRKALELFKGQDERQLDFVYEGGSKDAVFVATTLARYLSGAVAAPREPSRKLREAFDLVGAARDMRGPKQGEALATAWHILQNLLAAPAPIASAVADETALDVIDDLIEAVTEDDGGDLLAGLYRAREAIEARLTPDKADGGTV